jgi:dipeptidyl aminopeptidase/acylaminoacyl peptidase
MESFEQAPTFNIQTSLEKIPTVSEVQKIELDEDYFTWAKVNLPPETYEVIQSNYESIEARKYKYVSDGLSIAGFIWTPKQITRQLPVVVWNRGGTREYGSIGETRGGVYAGIPCDIVKQGSIVVGSEYRGGLGSEGSDEWGGADLRDVVHIKEIADQLPMSKPGKSIVAGESRGGMMSYLLASKEPWVKALISLAGTADLSMSAADDQGMEQVYKESFGGSAEEMRKRSATHFYQNIPKDLPMLIMQGSADDRVSVEQVRKLNGLLQESGHTVEYHEFPETGHGFYMPGRPDRQATLGFIERFLVKHLG